MIVVDASALLELLLNSPTGRQVSGRILRPDETVHAPHLLDLEVTQILRRYVRTGMLNVARAQEALRTLLALPLTRHPHDALLWRVWELRDNLTAYDAVYVALAEALGATLVTTDGRLASSRGHRATIEPV